MSRQKTLRVEAVSVSYVDEQRCTILHIGTSAKFEILAHPHLNSRSSVVSTSALHRRKIVHNFTGAIFANLSASVS